MTPPVQQTPQVLTTPRLQIVFDCADPTSLAAFWATALRLPLAEPPGAFTSWHAYYRSIGVPDEELAGEPDASDRIVDPAGVAPSFWFQKVPEGKVVKNRLHLDLTASGGRTTPLAERKAAVDAEVARLVEAGASVLSVHDTAGVDHYGVTLSDPEGNEFCVN